MPIHNPIAALPDAWTARRNDLHRHPEPTALAKSTLAKSALGRTAIAKRAAETAVEAARVVPMEQPTAGGEDFPFMLNAKLGNVIMPGAGKTGSDPQVHHPFDDSDDDVPPIGVSDRATLAKQLRPRAAR